MEIDSRSVVCYMKAIERPPSTGLKGLWDKACDMVYWIIVYLLWSIK